MSDMETTAEERTRWARHDPDPDHGGWLGKLTRDLDRAIARIAELEAELADARASVVGINAHRETEAYRAGVLAEREACAKIAYGWLTFSSVGRDIAATIRARSAL